MEEKRTSSAMWAAVVLLPIILLGSYVAGYYLRSETYITQLSLRRGIYFHRVRLFPTQLEERIFEPATKIESVLTNQHVVILRRWHGD